MKYTREDVQKAYDEVERRIQLDIKNGYLIDEDGYIQPETVENYRDTVLQGVYATLMVLSDDWPNVSQMCLEEEENRGWKII